MTQVLNTEQMTSAQRAKYIESAINDISHIATLPEITVKIIELVENPESTAQDLHLIIANDPALSARVLKVVNSAFYALPGQIGSIDRAIVLLGLNAVKNIAIAASMAKLFQGGRLAPSFAARDLWTHSIAVAAGVKLLADKVRLGMPDEGFLAGLIHDIGVMVEMQVRRPKLVQVIDRVENHQETFRQAEGKVFGITHEEFGTGLCQKWKFPDFLVKAAGYHHKPMTLPAESRTIAALIHVGDVMAARAGIGYAKTVDSTEIQEGVLDALRLTDSDIETAMEELPAAYDVADGLLSG